jgi:hypothetical protein
MLIALSMSLLFWSATCFAQGRYYKWVDKDGRVHFSNAPPGDAKGATPLGMRDQPRDVRSERLQRISEISNKITILINQAEVLIKANSNTPANKKELNFIALQLETELRDAGHLVAMVDPLGKTDITSTFSKVKKAVEKAISNIREYVGAKTILEQAERDKQREVTQEVRTALRNRPAHSSVWYPYKNPSRLIQLGMHQSEVESIAGKPDQKEFYTKEQQGGLIAMEGWYYVNDTGTQTSLLEFDVDTKSLTGIRSRP